MTWIKLDDAFPRHPKTLRAGQEAAWLFVVGLCYCSQYLTDGFIPTEVLPTLVPSKKASELAARLVAVDYWLVTEGGWEVVNYTEHQRTRESIEGERAATRDRVQRHRSRTRNGVTNAAATQSDAETDTDTPQTPQGGQRPVPQLVTMCDTCGELKPRYCTCPPTEMAGVL